jgi:putative DNA primase/helicase
MPRIKEYKHQETGSTGIKPRRCIVEIRDVLSILLKNKYPIIPSGGGKEGKRPLVKWEQYQTKLPSTGTIRRWNDKLKPQLWGIVTGQSAGIVVMDADDESAMALFQEEGLLPHVRTPRGGAHYWFQHPSYSVPTKAGISSKLDIRGDGGFINVLGKNPVTGGEYIIEILPTRDKLYPWDRMPKGILEAMSVSKAKPMAVLEAPIPKGQRNSELTRMAGVLRSAGMTQSEMLTALLDVNRSRCEPPLDEGEVQRIAKSISRYKPNDNEHFTDTGNAQLLTHLYGDQLRYDHRHKRWLVWGDHHWNPDRDGQVSRLAIAAAKTRYALASNVQNEELKKKMAGWAIRSENRIQIDACIAIAQKIEPFADAGFDWDTNRMLLGAENGIIDLKTGELREGRPEDRITMSTGLNFDPEAKCPRWERFIEEIFDDAELQDWIWRALGYSLAGDTTEQVVFMGHGQGANGKSRFRNAVFTAMGDYAQTTPFSTFALPEKSSTNDLAALENARFVDSSETNEDTGLNEKRIKAISGEDPMKARYLYHEFIQFIPHLKLWLFVNHKPEVKDDTYGIWRRMRLIPFTKRFAGKDDDKRLGEKLRAEAPGILSWLVRGCLEWQKRGLTPVPECVKVATEEYHQESDVLLRFIEEWCIEDSEKQVKASSLYYAYRDWAKGAGFGYEVMSSTAFGRKISERYKKQKKAEGMVYLGIHVADDRG